MAAASAGTGRDDSRGRRSDVGGSARVRVACQSATGRDLPIGEFAYPILGLPAIPVDLARSALGGLFSITAEVLQGLGIDDLTITGAVVLPSAGEGQVPVVLSFKQGESVVVGASVVDHELEMIFSTDKAGWYTDALASSAWMPQVAVMTASAWPATNLQLFAVNGGAVEHVAAKDAEAAGADITVNQEDFADFVMQELGQGVEGKNVRAVQATVDPSSSNPFVLGVVDCGEYGDHFEITNFLARCMSNVLPLLIKAKLIPGSVERRDLLAAWLEAVSGAEPFHISRHLGVLLDFTTASVHIEAALANVFKLARLGLSEVAELDVTAAIAFPVADNESEAKILAFNLAGKPFKVSSNTRRSYAVDAGRTEVVVAAETGSLPGENLAPTQAFLVGCGSQSVRVEVFTVAIPPSGLTVVALGKGDRDFPSEYHRSFFGAGWAEATSTSVLGLMMGSHRFDKQTARRSGYTPALRPDQVAHVHFEPGFSEPVTVCADSQSLRRTLRKTAPIAFVRECLGLLLPKFLYVIA